MRTYGFPIPTTHGRAITKQTKPTYIAQGCENSRQEYNTNTIKDIDINDTIGLFSSSIRFSRGESPIEKKELELIWNYRFYW